MMDMDLDPEDLAEENLYFKLCEEFERDHGRAPNIAELKLIDEQARLGAEAELINMRSAIADSGKDME